MPDVNGHPLALSPLAQRLLTDMARFEGRVEYNTRVLGGMFRATDLPRLDAAYEELRTSGLVEPTGEVLSFFGRPKPLFKPTDSGRAEAERLLKGAA